MQSLLFVLYQSQLPAECSTLHVISHSFTTPTNIAASYNATQYGRGGVARPLSTWRWVRYEPIAITGDIF